MSDAPPRIYQGLHRYRIVRCVGEGAMGFVYEAQNLDMSGARRALKVLKDPGFGRRFALEADTLSRLRHEHIVPMYEFFRDGDAYVIAMAFVEGEALSEMIDRGAPIAPDHALEIIKPILSALDHAHLQGIIHRDVKPSNILIDRSGKPWLCDFGIARQVGTRGMTAVGVTLGTAEYMSPEQIQTPTLLDHRTDVYSAGVVLFEMLTGRVPFTQASASDHSVHRQHVEKPPPRPSSINPALDQEFDRIVLKAMRKKSKSRYQGCGNLMADIERYQGERAAVDSAPAARPRGSREFHVYEHKTMGLAAVKEGFSWAALFGNLIWMFGKGLYSLGFLWLAAYLFLAAVVPLLGVSGVVVLVVALVPLLLLPGVKGNAWREAHLATLGYALKRNVAAATAVAAVALIDGGH